MITILMARNKLEVLLNLNKANQIINYQQTSKKKQKKQRYKNNMHIF